MAKEKDKKPSYEVVQEFRDIEDFNKVHAKGDDVSAFEEARLEELVKNGLVKKND